MTVTGTGRFARRAVAAHLTRYEITYRIVSADGDAVYRVASAAGTADPDWCSCPGHQAGRGCYHLLACWAYAWVHVEGSDAAVRLAAV